MKQFQVAQFITAANRLTNPRKRVASASQAPDESKYLNHPALPLLTPYKRIIRAGLELRMNNMQIAAGIKAMDTGANRNRIARMTTSTLSGYISVIRSHYKMPASKGFISQW